MEEPFIQMLLRDLKSKLGTFIIILIFAFLAGCRSKNVTTSETTIRESVDTNIRIPADSAKIQIDLKKQAEKDGVVVDWSKFYIPPTTQTSPNGRTSVTVQLKDGKLDAKANVEAYEQEIQFLRELITKDKKVEPQQPMFVWILILVLIVIILLKK